MREGERDASDIGRREREAVAHLGEEGEEKRRGDKGEEKPRKEKTKKKRRDGKKLVGARWARGREGNPYMWLWVETPCCGLEYLHWLLEILKSPAVTYEYPPLGDGCPMNL